MEMKANVNIRKLTLSAMFLAIGIILPMLTGQVPEIGSMLLPMHIPVFLCAFICGWEYATPMAFFLPLIRTLLFGRPNLYPEAIAIAFELAAYAFVCGFIYSIVRRRNMGTAYISLVISMICGRAVRAFVQMILLKLVGLTFSLSSFFTAVIVSAIPGMILQLAIIPTLAISLERNEKLFFFSKKT